MAGGTWTAQDKKIPGVYINTQAEKTVEIKVGSKGIVAIAEPLNWGNPGVIQEITPGEDLTPYIGYDISNSNAMFLREMMKGSDTTDGPNKILLYRPTGTSGVKATVTVGALTVTAKYTGTRGNDLSVIIAANPGGGYDIDTVIDGAVVDSQNVTNLSSLVSNDWVDFSGSGTTITATAGSALTGGVNPTVASSDYASFLTALEPFAFDILAYDGSDATTIAAMIAFIKRINTETGRRAQCVMAGATAEAADSELVIAIMNGVTLEDGTVLTAGQAVWWLAGVEAGAKYNQSLTYAMYPGAVRSTSLYSDAQAIAATEAGGCCFVENYGDVVLCTDINTKVTAASAVDAEFKKNRVMRVLMQFCNDTHYEYSKYYIGKVSNIDNVGLSLLRGWAIGYLAAMEGNQGIRNFSPEDVVVFAGEAIDSAVVQVWLQPVDSIEKIYATVTVVPNVR